MINEQIDKINREVENEGEISNDIKRLVEENLKLTEEVYKMSKYIKRFVVFSQIASVLKILLFAIPIILGILYLPPLLEQVFSQYQELLGIPGKVNNLQSAPGAGDILNLLKK